MNGQILNNRYKINKIIGTGGMSIVYEGYDTVLNREVAIKILKDNFVEGEESLDRLKIEASASASIIDENIVSIYDVAQTEINGKTIEYIVMEKIDGRTLKEIIVDEAPLDYKRIVNYAMQITKALQTAHLHGIVHRDIKPANILITKEDKVKVLDFGIARVSKEATITYTSSILGTVHYISPEQAKGQQTDSRSDLYSLGVLVYEMATGKVPFDGESPVSIAVKHIQEQPLLLTDVDENINKDFAYLVDRLLSKNPEDRYKTASNLLSDLNRLRNGNTLDLNLPYIDDNSDTIKQSSKEIEKKTRNKYKSKPIVEQEKKEEKRNNKIITISLIVLGIAVLMFGLVNIINSYINQEQEQNLITVPSVVDISEDQAVSRLKELGLNVSIKERVYDDTIIEGNVIAQSIKTNTNVDTGTNVELTISRGKELVRVPNIVGYDLENVEELVQEYGFELGGRTTEQSDEPQGQIISQTPRDGEMAERGSAINIVLSSGPNEETVQVPNVRGYSQNVALNTIREAGLVIRDIDQQSSDEIEENEVISQSIYPGTEVEIGTEISIVVSTGPETETETETEIETETETETERETETETETETDVELQEQEYIFNISIPKSEADTFNVQIIDKATGEIVYNEDLDKNSADGNGNIPVRIMHEQDSEFRVLYDGEEVSLDYE